MADATTKEAIQQALAKGHNQLIDISTIGRKSGEARRLEIVFHTIDGRIYISGRPSPKTRDWILNLTENPRMTLHLKQGVQADLPATGRVITDEAERRAVLTQVAKNWGRADVEEMVREAPLIEVTLD